MTKNFEYFIGLRYRIELEEQEEGGFVARHPELSGCIAQGETVEEAVRILDDARRLWIEVRLEDGLQVPEPRVVSNYSGKLLVRMPKSLHEELAEAAERDGVSLNQFVVAALSRRVWSRHAEPVTEFRGFVAWNRQCTALTEYSGIFTQLLLKTGAHMPPNVSVLGECKAPNVSGEIEHIGLKQLRLVQA